MYIGRILLRPPPFIILPFYPQFPITQTCIAFILPQLSNCNNISFCFFILSHDYQLIWNFHPDKSNPAEIIAFIDWFFPLLKKYDATPANICPECRCQMNQSNSGWYNISGTAATMHLHKKCRGKIKRNAQQASSLLFKKYPTYKRGILGAVIGAVPATLLCTLAYQYGDLVIPTGMLIVFLSWLGYTFNCGFRSKWKPIILYLISLCGILLGHLIHPLFGTPLLSLDATDPFVQLFVSQFSCSFSADLHLDSRNRN